MFVLEPFMYQMTDKALLNGGLTVSVQEAADAGKF